MKSFFKYIYCYQFSFLYVQIVPIRILNLSQDLIKNRLSNENICNNYLHNNSYCIQVPLYILKLLFVIYQSQEPSSQPSLHLWFTSLQSNSDFPSFLLTSLWILHSHWLSFSCDPVSGGECFSCSCRSSAHILQG